MTSLILPLPLPTQQIRPSYSDVVSDFGAAAIHLAMVRQISDERQQRHACKYAPGLCLGGLACHGT